MELKAITTTFIICTGMITSNPAFAGGQCAEFIAESSVYFVPHIKDYCKSSTKPCNAFKKEVRMQGSGTLSGNRVLTYTGQTKNIGSCETAIGASGECLIPFVSVAADPKFYSMGDIIQMPGMKDKEIKLPNGKTMIHPGYFIVHDTGGAIKGSNRFDFFTGSFDDHHAKNAFGYEGFADMAMTDKGDCSNKKQFRVIRRDKSGYENILAAIDAAKQGQSVEKSYAISANERRFVAKGLQ